MDLASYVNRQTDQNPLYLRMISENAMISYGSGNINELVVDVAVLGVMVEDEMLLEKVKEVLRWT